MKTLSFLICLFVCSLSLYAQDAELKIYQEELGRAMKLKDRDSIGAAYCHLGEYYAYRNSDSARYYINEGLKYAREEYRDLYMTLLVNLAETYSAKGEFDEAFSRYTYALREAVRLKYDNALQANILSALGVIYRRKAMPDSALVYYNQALDLLETSDAYDEKMSLLTHIAILYVSNSRLDEGEAYIRRAISLTDKCDDIDVVLYAGTTAGALSSLRGNYEEGAEMIHRVLAKARAQQKPRFILKSITYLIGLFQKMDKQDSIAHYMKEAEVWARQMPANSNEVVGYQEALYQVLTKIGRYRESLAIQQRMLATADANLPSPVNKLYLMMARNYNALKDYPHAMEYYEKANQATDSLYKEKVNEELSELTVKYETKEKEYEIARLTQEQLRQKAKTLQWGIIAAIAVFAFVLLIFYYRFRQKRIRKEEELKLAQSYIEGLERERVRLAKELHDGVCNDLLGIGMQMQSMQPTVEAKQELLELLEQIRGDVRCISHELMPPKFQYVTLEETIEAYLERLSVPAGMRLTFSKENSHIEWSQIPDEIAYEIYRILQELIGNVLKHSGATWVDVHLALSKEEVGLVIRDNGKAFSDFKTVSGGIGLTTIHERVKSVGGALSTNPEESMQMFKLTVPLPI